MYTLSLVARTFSLRDVLTSRTRLKVLAVCMSLRLAISPLMFYPSSLLSPHGHFDTTFPSAPSSSSITRPKSAGQAHFHTSAEEFCFWADPTHSTGYEPKLPDKTTSVDVDTTAINDPNLRTTWKSKIWSEEILNTHHSSHSVSLHLTSTKSRAVRASGGRQKIEPQIRTCLQALQVADGDAKSFHPQHPKDSTSWKMPDDQSLVSDLRVYSIDGVLCRWRALRLEDQTTKKFS